MMPAERDDYCTWCGTAPCAHPEPTLTLGMVLRDRHESWQPLIRDLVVIILLGLVGWFLLAAVAVA
jgi:hypothetical protein